MQNSVRFSERLVSRRNRLNWTQPELAEKSGVSARSISDYERGLANPGAEQLQKLATALDVSSDWLMGGEDRAAPVLPPALKDEPVPYRTRTISLEVLPNDSLDQLFFRLSELLGKAEASHRGPLLTALNEVHEEIRQRKGPDSDPKGAALAKLPPELREIATGMEAVAEQSARHALRESPHSPPTDERRGRGKPPDGDGTSPKPAVPKRKAGESEGQGKAPT